jgi:DNA-binding CsgD family transcriptional regulator
VPLLPWPLTGRSDELQLIKAALVDPALSGIVVSGAAGVGKSRIAREAMSFVAAKGRPVRWAMATSAARTLPLGAFASFADSIAADSLGVVRDVISSLTSTSAGTTPVIGVDDVHLLDDLSAFVLHQIVHRRAAHILLTIRDGERIPQAVLDVWKGGQFAQLDLQPLSRAEVATLAAATLGGSVDPDAAARLWKLTRGNVLYLRNIVDQEVADGRLAQHHGVWRWTGEPVVSPSLVELVQTRIGGLPSSTSDVLDALAVGEPLALTSLTRIADQAAVEDAEARGLITLEPADNGADVRLAHPLYGEVRRRCTAATRLRRIRALVVGELAAADDRDDMSIVVRRATLSLDSDLQRDPDLLVRAAQGAVSLGDLALAERLADAAIRAGAGVEASLLRFRALSWLSRGVEADALLADIRATEVTGAEWGKIVFSRAVNRLITLGEPDGAKKLVDEASHGAPVEARPCIDAFLTVYWAAMGNTTAAIETSKSFVLDELPDIICAAVAWALAAAYGDAGRSAEALAVANYAYGFMTRSRDAAHMRYVIADGHIGALILSGCIAEARDVAEQLRELATDRVGPEPLYSMALAGRAALGAGRLDTAHSLLGQAADALSGLGESNGWLYRYRLPRAIALAMSGLSVDAASALAALEKRRHPCRQHVDYELGLAHAWVAAAEGAVSNAVTTALAAAESARANGQFAAEVMCLQTAAQFGDGSGARRLRELEMAVEGPRVGVAARFAAALVAHDGAELAEVSKEFERIGDLVAAVDAAAHAAISYRRSEMRGTALAFSARAEELAQRCCGASTPALRHAVERVPLTDREREVVILIGEGLSNRAIAERLTLSIRTVEGHIYRAMLKTGTNSRDGLTALLPRRPRRVAG